MTHPGLDLLAGPVRCCMADVREVRAQVIRQAGMLGIYPPEESADAA